MTTFVRTAAELRRTLAAQPFEVGPADTYFVTFLKDRLSKAKATALEALSNDFDTLVVQGRERALAHARQVDRHEAHTKAWADIVGHHRSTSRNVNMLRRLMAS